MNVLVYVVDALRADHVSCYGYGRETTPRTDALAAEGLRYDRCFSPATWTKPVAASLLTGTYPPTHGARHRDDRFDGPVPRLPGLLAEGTTTAGFSAMGNVSSSVGFDAGFDRFEDLYRDPAVVERRTTTTAGAEKLAHESESDETIALPRATDVADAAVDWLEATEEPFLAFCWTIDPHLPYTTPPDEREFGTGGYDGPVDGSYEGLPDTELLSAADRRRLRTLYDSEIHQADAALGRILDALERQGRYEDTAVVVVGDHGEGFLDHGHLLHADRPYDELIRVPCVLKPPAGAGIDAASSDALVSLVDVVPTLLALADGETDPRGEPLQGRPLPPLGPSRTDEPVFSETQLTGDAPRHLSARTGRWKYIERRATTSDGGDGGGGDDGDPPGVAARLARAGARLLGNRELAAWAARNPRLALERYRRTHDADRLLFDLRADPVEANNVLADHPGTVRRLEGALEDWLADCRALNREWGSSDRGLDADTEEQLRQLGYLE